ncbi:MAG: HDOD domain-containing protein [Gemmataceae bacterium]|nr:HDOD domain-containing protein [Gemmataceae bacterium]
MGASDLGETAARLSWISPSAASLMALARAPASAWQVIRTDPGAVLLLLRQAPPTLSASSFLPTLLRDASFLEHAQRHLDAPDSVAVDWNDGSVHPIYQAALRYADCAASLAEQSKAIDVNLAWATGLVAPLGWLAMCGIDGGQAAGCLADPTLHENPGETQRRWWGHDQAAIARRLARHWRLPPWLTAIVGHLGLPVETAKGLGADVGLFRLVQLAVALVQKEAAGLALTVGAPIAENATALGLQEFPVRRLELQPTGQEDWSGPATVPLLRELLHLAAENRRLADAPITERLERDMDHLHRILEQQRAGESARLLEQNLATLAEFAAGAGHEINNPLAVISGQAQYLMGHEADPARQRALQTIVAQTQRVHDILTELMQFARPGRPQKRPLELASLIREACVSLGGLADQRRVRLVCPEPEPGSFLHADPRQARTALICLLRNAIEAAPPEGWAGVRVIAPTPDRIDLLVEDSGPGPTPAQRERMFDPFYSGRPAGRGRGLGLPTAWRLARENDGSVYFDDHSEGPTRFVLSLPREIESHDIRLNGHANEVPLAS